MYFLHEGCQWWGILRRKYSKKLFGPTFYLWYNCPLMKNVFIPTFLTDDMKDCLTMKNVFEISRDESS